MAAWQGRKVWSTGQKLVSTDLNALVDQSVMVFASATARDAAISSPTEGMTCWLQDVNNMVYYDGSAWQTIVANSGWVSYTPTITASTTNPTFSYTTQAGFYNQLGKTVRFRMFLKLNVVTNVGSGTYSFDLPVAAKDTNQVFFGTFIRNSSLGQIYRLTGTNSVSASKITNVAFQDASSTVVNQANPSAPASTDVWIFEGTYEAA